MSSLPYLGLALALALGNIGALAAADELDTVESLKQKAEADLGIAVENLKLKYLIALEKLQKKLAADGDLDGALAVKNEIGRANGQQPSLFGQAGAGAAEVVAGGKLTLAAEEARLGNGTQLDSAKGLLKGWSGQGPSATWSLKATQPGTYKLTLHYRSGNLGGASSRSRLAHTMASSASLAPAAGRSHVASKWGKSHSPLRTS